MDENTNHIFSNLLALQTHIIEFSKSYLNQKGWFGTLGGSPSNDKGPLPWYTYPAISFLEPIIKKDWTVFEYGCGNSTLWWSSFGARVYSVEHNENWYKKIIPKIPENATITHVDISTSIETTATEHFKEFSNQNFDLPISKSTEHNIYHGLLNEEFQSYVLEITKHAKQSFDAIVVDGMARAFSAFMAVKYLKPSGILIFDNSDRWQYNDAYKYLVSEGFRRIDFYGPGPVNTTEWCTSIFLKDLSVLKGHSEVSIGSGDLRWKATSE